MEVASEVDVLADFLFLEVCTEAVNEEEEVQRKKVYIPFLDIDAWATGDAEVKFSGKLKLPDLPVPYPQEKCFLGFKSGPYKRNYTSPIAYYIAEQWFSMPCDVTSWEIKDYEIVIFGTIRVKPGTAAGEYTPLPTLRDGCGNLPLHLSYLIANQGILCKTYHYQEDQKAIQVLENMQKKAEDNAKKREAEREERIRKRLEERKRREAEQARKRREEEERKERAKIYYGGKRKWVKKKM